MASREEINKILTDMRYAIDQNKFIPIQRRKNLDTLAQLGLTWQDAKDEIYTLTDREYIKGPETDWDRPSTDSLWIFKKRIESDMIYIKFKVQYQEDGSIKLVSFHLDES